MKHAKTLVTGGAGFIGRWVVKELLEAGHEVVAFDNGSSGTPENLAEFEGHPKFGGLIVGDVTNVAQVEALFTDEIDVCFHLAASINVQDSIDHPPPTVQNDVIGTLNVLEASRQQFFRRNGIVQHARPLTMSRYAGRMSTPAPKVVFVSTCMVYGPMAGDGDIDEGHTVDPRSPYAAGKLAAEYLSLSYHRAYGLPVVVLRPFNTFGPYQRSDHEGGVVSIFLDRAARGLPLRVFGDGSQTRDLLYVEDCARFIVAAGMSKRVDGTVLNAGSGQDIAIADLARRIAGPDGSVKLVAHEHPQAEISGLRCDHGKATELLGWRPQIDLREGLERTRRYLAATDECEASVVA